MTPLKPGRWSFDVRSTDTDFQDRLHLFALFSYMQEAAYHHVRCMADIFGDFEQLGLCWLLIRVSVRLHDWPRWGDTVTVETAHRGARRLTFIRDFTFYDQHGRSFGQATSEWLVADRKTHRPQRPQPGWPCRPIEGNGLACPRLKPQDTASSIPLLLKYADFSDLDRNNHVNNTRYVAWGVDTVQALRSRISGGAMPPLAVAEFDIHYINEVGTGARIDLFGSQDPDNLACYDITAQLHPEHTPVFRARLRLSGQNSEQL
jgi:acyl-ACP thioesterase